MKDSKMKRKHILYPMFLLILFAGCGQDEVELVIDPELVPYMDAFVEEATLRNIHVDEEMRNLTASILDINRRNVAGQCTQGEGTVSQILIDSKVWRAYTHLQKEAVVFHELGHCVLKRGHRDDQDLEGNCLSLMESGLGTCQMNYTTISRSTYLDELFEE